MRIGFVDCELEDNKKNNANPFPNLPLMKLSAWHKKQGDTTEWYDPLLGGGHMTRYMFQRYFLSQMIIHITSMQKRLSMVEVVSQLLSRMAKRCITKKKINLSLAR